MKHSAGRIEKSRSAELLKQKLPNDRQQAP